MYILGLTGMAGTQCHDSSAAILKDGVLLCAVEQERFSRKKHAPGEGPTDAILYCLKKVGITLDKVNYIASSWTEGENLSKIDRGIPNEYSSRMFPESIFRCKNIPPIYFIKHHIAHIASSFYQSGFGDAAVIVVDGQGETESITLAKAEKDKISIIRTYGVVYSLGCLYEAACKYSGLGYRSYGKLMALASYGKPDQEIPIAFNSCNGKFKLLLEGIVDGKSTFIETLESYSRYFKEHCYPYREGNGLDVISYVNFAASIQKTLEDIIHKLANGLVKESISHNLIMSGGVALNCSVNGMLDRKELFKNFFIYPPANDAGTSVGAALEVFRYFGIFKKNVPERVSSVYYGPEYTDEDIVSALQKYKLSSILYKDEALSDLIASEIYNGNIIGLFQGKAEFGPRALGSRSILGDPSHRETLIKINLLKEREMWRPLAPAVLEKYYKEIFEDNSPNNLSEFMLKAVKVRVSWELRIPAVIHIDQTSRPQLVKYNTNKRFYNIILKYYLKSGIPLIVNTSFNLRGIPLVNSPEEAIEIFTNKELMDILVLGNRYISRNML